jgi:sporulation protein YlmC with PRC-barrel domain
MKGSRFLGTVTACISLGLAAPLLAATPIPTARPAAAVAVSPVASPGKNVADTKPAVACLNDRRAFDVQMQKDGYWLSGSGFGYGYPMVGYPGRGMAAGATGTGYQDVRPGYEVRTLIASANILARHGQGQPYEAVLATTRDVYKTYVSDMQSGKVPRANVPNWQQAQIAVAQPDAGATTAFRSDQLLGTDVRDSQNNALGSVDDLVMSPATGKTAYLVISRGGIFGIGEKYVPVPWENFKATSSVNLLILDTTKAVMDAAPQVSSDQFAPSGHFDQKSRKVDAYWKAHLSAKAAFNG